MSEAKVRVVLVDDHAMFRSGVRTELGAAVEVVGEAADVQEAVAAVLATAPDVVLLDVHLPGGGGIEVIAQCQAHGSQARFLALSVSDAAQDVIGVIRAGARGYLLKDADDDEIAAVLRGIARGEAIFGPTTARRLLDMLGRAPEQSEHTTPNPFPQLTQREQEVLEQLARGKRNATIADELFLSERTVRNYVSNIFTKLQVADRAQAIAAARDAGIGKPPT